MNNKIAIIGTGNLGKAIADGLLMSGVIKANQLTLTRRNLSKLEQYANKGINITSDNILAVKNSDIIIVSVKPQKFEKVINEILPVLNENHKLISTVTGVEIKDIAEIINKDISIFRAMPNTAISIRQSMTCISSYKSNDTNVELVQNLFNQLGKTAVINDELMGSATILAASGIAFALRYIRASMQAGIEIGFESELAQLIASQTVKGASSLVVNSDLHPEREVDRVTTPLGVTITGLNTMEFNGFSSSVIQGVLSSYDKINKVVKQK